MCSLNDSIDIVANYCMSKQTYFIYFCTIFVLDGPSHPLSSKTKLQTEALFDLKYR